MTQVTILAGGTAPPNPNTFVTELVCPVALPPGLPVTTRTGGPHGILEGASSNGSGTTYAIGLTSGSVGIGKPARLQYAGPLTLSLEDWADVVTNFNGTHVLTPHAEYYLGTDGKITDTPAAGGGTFVAPLGRAISTTTLVINLGHPIAN